MNLCAPKGGEPVFNHGVKYAWVLRLPYGDYTEGTRRICIYTTKQYMIMANRISRTDMIKAVAVDIKGYAMASITNVRFRTIGGIIRYVVLNCGVNKLHYIDYIRITNITKGWSAKYSVLGKKIH